MSPTNPNEKDVAEQWVPLLKKTTTESGLLFATQKDPDAKKTTTRTWEINVGALNKDVPLEAILKFIREVPDN